MTFRPMFLRSLLVAGMSVATLLAVPTVGHAQAPDEFHVGDRIALTIEGSQPLQPSEPQISSDTVVVREGLIVRLAPLGDISLAGVKRSNVESYLSKQVAKYLKNAVVHATPLVRISVLGQVGKPGFYTVPSDMLLSDVVMHAGGPTSEADLNKTVVKREGTEVLSESAAKDALANGSTLDQLAIAPGDQVIVGEKSHLGFGTVVQIIGVVASLAGVLLALSYRR